VPARKWLVASLRLASASNRTGGDKMIILGIILLIIGFIAKIAILWTIGIILVVIGLILAIAGFAGREIGGRKHWF
jgi:uncharacterized membrane protein HdeD (DUF308 family)